MSNQRRFVLLLCAFLCSAQTWNMDGEDRNAFDREKFAEFVFSTRQSAVTASILPEFAIWSPTYGKVPKADLLILKDYIPAQKEEILDFVVNKWAPDETLSEKHKRDLEGKRPHEVAHYLRESKVERLQELTGRQIKKEEVHREFEKISSEARLNIVLQDLLALYKYGQ